MKADTKKEEKHGGGRRGHDEQNNIAIIMNAFKTWTVDVVAAALAITDVISGTNTVGT